MIEFEWIVDTEESKNQNIFVQKTMILYEHNAF